MLAALHDGRDANTEPPGDTSFEKVAEEVFTRYDAVGNREPSR